MNLIGIFELPLKSNIYNNMIIPKQTKGKQQFTTGKLIKDDESGYKL
jgi:hypothetical protein